MLEWIVLLNIFCFTLFGFACLSFSLDRHWRDVIGKRKIQSRQKVFMRILGYGCLGLSCLFFLYRDGSSMGTILWFMILTCSGVCIAFTLAWRPNWLLPLALIMSKR